MAVRAELFLFLQLALFCHRVLLANVKTGGKLQLILHTSSEVKVQGGEAFSLSCEVIGDPDVVVRWRKDGKVVESSNKWKVQPGNITAYHATTQNQGTFVCEGLTNETTINSQPVTVIVMGTSFVDVPPPVMDVTLGETVSMWCNVSEPTLGLNTSWYFSTKRLDPNKCNSHSSSESCVSAVNASLKIINVQFQDAGQYRCEVTAPDHLLVAVTYLRLHSPVEFLNQLPSAISLDAGSPLSLVCNATGKPPLKVTWVKDGQALTSGLANQTGAAHIEHVKKEDEGLYTCRASNKYGHRKQSVYVVVKTVPKKLVLRVESIDWYEATVGWHVVGDGGSVITFFSLYNVAYNSTSNVQPIPFNVSAGESNTKLHGLASGVIYRVVVWANNRLGSGPPASILLRTYELSSPPLLDNHPVSEQLRRLRRYSSHHRLIHYTVMWLGMFVLISVMVCAGSFLVWFYRNNYLKKKAITRIRVRGDSESSDVMSQMYSLRAHSRPWSFVNPAFQEDGNTDCGNQPIVGSQDSTR